MIEIRTTVIGDRQITETLKRAPEAIQFRVLSEMSEIGQEITDDAQAAVPVKTGALRRAIRFSVSALKANAKLEVKHTGKGARHAHLIERGVARQQIDVHKKVMAQRVRFVDGKTKRGRKYRLKGELLYKRWHVVPAQPYFMPAVDAAGDVPARLQAAVTQAAADASAGGA